MTTDEAIAFARARGFKVWSLAENTDGNWTCRLHNPKRAIEVTGKPGYNDAFTDHGRAATPADAILAALRLRYDRETGKTVEIALPMLTEAQEAAWAASLGALTAVLRGRR